MSTLNITDPEPAIRNEQFQNDTSKRNKILLGVGAGVLLLGGAAAAVALTVGKSSSSSGSMQSDAKADPISGDADGYKGAYGTGYLQPPNAADIIAQLPPFQAAAPLVAALGTSVDWRTNANIVTPVKNQGGCGSCWAFSAVESMEGSYGMKYNKQVILSTEQLVDCDLKDGGCNGGWMMTAWTQYFKNNARPYSLTESQYPYSLMSPNGKQRNTCTANDALGPVMVTNTANIAGTQTWSLGVEQTVMGWLAQNGPASIAVNADGWGNYKSGIATTASLKCTQAINHGVQLVGYGTENGQDYWIIRNSWSASWGEKGFMRIARGANTCCVLCAVMGVTVAATSNVAPTSAPQPPANPNKITAGQQLAAGQQITSPDGNIIFKMQADGNLVLYKTVFNAVNTLQAVWASGTFGANFVVKMQPDCNLVAYNGNGGAVWASGSTKAGDAACSQAYFQVNNDATASVVKSGGVIWATNGATPTTTRPPVAPTTTKPPVTNSPATTKAPAKSLSVMSLGCWTDNAQRQLPTRLSGASNAIMRDCAWLAYNQGKTFFGLQYGGECWGGTTDPRSLGASSGCNMPCQGNAAETCGGSWANTVYQIVSTAAVPPSATAEAFNPPPQNFNIDTDCKFFAGAPSYCWRCTDNTKNTVECRDATVSDLSRDLELGTAGWVADSLCPDGRKEFAAEICGKGGQLSKFDF
jgi:hypothetical protein